MDTHELQDELINKYSTKKFGMEYGGYLSNHLLHGVVALYELGASKQLIDDFAEHYAKMKLEAIAPDHEDPYEVATVEATSSNEDTAIPSEERVQELLGRREDFDALLAFYGHEVKLLGTDGAVKKHLPHLAGGLCGALLHGLIQLGYSYHIGGERLVAEGLAYFHFSYLSFDEPEKQEETSGTKALTREEAVNLAHALKNHEFILSEMRRQLEARVITELPLGLFQKKLNTLSAHPQRGSAAAFQLISSTLDQYDFSKVNGNFALDFSLWLYTMIDHNDFVIAHAVTSAWSLKQIEHLLDHDNLVRAWKVWFHVAITAFVVQNVSDLSVRDICEQHASELSALDSWQEIIDKALALQDYPDEHVYKVVQIAHEHAALQSSSSFLSDEERAFVTRKAASKVIAVGFQLI